MALRLSEGLGVTGDVELGCIWYVVIAVLLLRETATNDGKLVSIRIADVCGVEVGVV